MFKVEPKLIVDRLVKEVREMGQGCRRAFVAGSGGVDSSVVTTLLCRAFGPENTVVLFRDIRSDRKHYEDVLALQKVLGFKLIYIDANPLYDQLLEQCREQFLAAGIEWHEENSAEAEKLGWDNAYGSLKSRMTTPLAGFIAKAVDNGRGRIYGTGNAEEDGLLRYFDKYGDGAVDNNIIDGLTKLEVRQLALYFSDEYEAPIFKRIAEKIPSADLLARGEGHNDEGELTAWARRMGFDIDLSYGTCEQEGNIAWGLKEDLDRGVVTGRHAGLTLEELKKRFSYSEEQLQLIAFLRQMEKNTRHKVEPLPGLPRKQLREEGLVD